MPEAPMLTPLSLRNLGEGDWVVEESIQFLNQVGDKVSGIGAGQYIPPENRHRGYTSNLIWEGTEEDRPILHFQGCGIIVEKVTFVDAPIGILLAKMKRGLGTGKMVVRDCYFDECRVAFEAGYKISDHNNDSVVLDHVISDNAESLLRLRNAQAMGFSIRDCVAKGSRTENIIDVFSGGCIYADNLKVINGKCILRLRSREAAGGDTSGIGSSNGLYTLRNIELDENAGTCKIVQMDEHYPVNIDVVNVQVPFKPWTDAIAAGSPATMYEMRGNSVLTVTSSNLYENSITWEDKKRSGDNEIPNIMLNRCRFSGNNIKDVLSKDKSTGKCYFTALHCIDNKGNPLPDTSGYVDA
jgi:hypothetical protein